MLNSKGCLITLIFNFSFILSSNSTFSGWFSSGLHVVIQGRTYRNNDNVSYDDLQKGIDKIIDPHLLHNMEETRKFVMYVTTKLEPNTDECDFDTFTNSELLEANKHIIWMVVDISNINLINGISAENIRNTPATSWIDYNLPDRPAIFGNSDKGKVRIQLYQYSDKVLKDRQGEVKDNLDKREFSKYINSVLLGNEINPQISLVLHVTP